MSFIYGRCSVTPDTANKGRSDSVGGVIDLRQPVSVESGPITCVFVRTLCGCV